MSDNINIKQIADKIIELEKRHSLLEWKVDDVYVWQAARANIYITILNKLVHNNSGTSQSNYTNRIKTLFRRLFINSVRYNPFFSLSKCEVIVFDSGRMYSTKNEFIDIYTYYLCQDLKKQNISYCLYNTSHKTDKLGSRNTKVKHLDFVYIVSEIAKFFINAYINSEDLNKVILIKEELEIEFGINLNLEDIFQKEVRSFKARYMIFKTLFRIKNAEKLYLVGSSDKASIIKAAKDCKMIVSELQHGLIVKDGLIAHYPYTPEDSLEYFPNKFYLWEGLNMCTAKLPLSSSNICTFANKHLNKMLQENINIKRNKNQILVVSQPYSSKELLSFILKNAQHMKEYSFVYKLHPVENTDQIISEFEKYPVDNIKVINNNKSIYQLFSESAYTIGINSSALFEAAYFGSNVIIVDLPGIEMASSLIDNGRATIIQIEQRLIDLINQS